VCTSHTAGRKFYPTLLNLSQVIAFFTELACLPSYTLGAQIERKTHPGFLKRLQQLSSNNKSGKIRMSSSGAEMQQMKFSKAEAIEAKLKK